MSKNKKQKNNLLWVLQILMALWFIAGGVYMVNNYANVASIWALQALPKAAWVILGIIQIVSALGLVLPSKLNVSRNVTPLAAVCLTVISLFGVLLYLEYSRFPGMLWGVLPAIITAFIAYKRWRR